MIVSYKYRAYPDATTEERLNTALDTCRWLYNKLSKNDYCAGERVHSDDARNAGADCHTERRKSISEGCILKVLPDGQLLSEQYSCPSPRQRRTEGRSANSGSRAHPGIGRSTITNLGSRSTVNTARSRSRRSERFRFSCTGHMRGP